jgi:hypothetical protein
MGSFVDKLSESVAEGYIFMPNSSFKACNAATIQEFLRIQESSPPQEIHQLEAFGGTIYKILVDKFSDDSKILNVQNWMFIIYICKEHIDIEYLVVCVLVILRGHIYGKYRKDISVIHSEIYSFLVLLTEYHTTKKPYWSVDLTWMWLCLFDVNTELHSIFLQNTELVLKFLDILTCKPRGHIIPRTNTGTSEDIFVGFGLVPIYRSSSHELCFNIVYNSLLEKNMLFQETIAQYWPFILRGDGQLLPRDEILNILKQIKVEENLPKSARKR